MKITENGVIFSNVGRNRQWRWPPIMRAKSFGDTSDFNIQDLSLKFGPDVEVLDSKRKSFVSHLSRKDNPAKYFGFE